MKNKALPTDNPKNYYHESVETQKKLLEWIAANLIERGGSWRGSYELKEIFGSDTGVYVSNGTMKTAMRISGFKVQDDRELKNWGFKINKRSPAILKFYKLDQKA